MNIYKFDVSKNFNNEFESGSILLLGEFEVFHKGHYKLFERAKQLITNNNKIGILIIDHKQTNTFQTLENRLNNLAQIGFDFVIVADFNFDFKSLEGDQFIKYIESSFGVGTFIMGEDFRFGKDRKYSANDIKSLTTANVEIIKIFKYNDKKISSSDIKQMHEFGEYNIINQIIVNPLVFDINLFSKRIKWKSEEHLPHHGNYYFKMLMDDYWYSGLIHFTIDKQIEYKLINHNSDNEIFDQLTKIKLINIERIITNSRVDNINEDDINKTKLFFSKK